MANTFDRVAQGGLCVGCGVCAGVCPRVSLTMRMNRFGEFRPTMTNEPCNGCSICLRSCPFADDPSGTGDETALAQKQFGTQPGIRHTPEVGYYLACYAGYSLLPHQREERSSGGLATWLLQTFLRRGVVDAVSCVFHTEAYRPLFSYRLVHTPPDVAAAAKSAYYPVELSGTLRHIQGGPHRRYAVVALPCVAKALRRAMRHNPHLRERIPVIVGLVCGQMRSAQYADFLALKCGFKPSRILHVDYRTHEPGRAAEDYGCRVRCQCSHGIVEKTLYRSEGLARVWQEGFFRLDACNYCDDVFAECADVAFMDAWLPEYRRSWEGTNLVLVRTSLVGELVDRYRDRGEIVAEPVDVGRLMDSQRDVLKMKREMLQHRLYLAHRRVRNGKVSHVPAKRIPPRRITGGYAIVVACQEHMGRLSREALAADATTAALRRLTRTTAVLRWTMHRTLFVMSCTRRLRNAVRSLFDRATNRAPGPGRRKPRE